MKTISELESELEATLVQEKAQWEKVRSARDIYDDLLKPWIKLRDQTENLAKMIEIRKEMEASK